MAKGTIRLLAVMALLAGLQTGAAGAAELKVLSAVALRPALQELAPVFEKSSGHKLKIAYDTAGKVAEKVTGEDAIDVAILTKPLFDKAARAAKMVDGTRTNLAQQQLGGKACGEGRQCQHVLALDDEAAALLQLLAEDVAE